MKETVKIKNDIMNYIENKEQVANIYTITFSAQ